MGEPYSLDPASIRGTSGTYLFSNIFHSLYRYHNDRGLIPVGAKSCIWVSKLKLKCKLNQKAKYSDGTPVLAKHYVTSMRRLLLPETKTVQSELLINLKNVKEILDGRLPASALGVKASGKFLLIFDFAKPDSEFLYKLTSPNLTPLKDTKIPQRTASHKLVSFGPYVISSWKPGRKITLTPNSYYFGQVTLRPNVEIYFVDDDSTAQRLFETKKMSFLRRLVTSEIPRFKSHPGFMQVPIGRFDYIGFGEDLKAKPLLRKALAHSLEYSQLAKLYHALGRPGCPSMPRRLMAEQPCYEFNLSLAKKTFAKLDKADQKLQLHLAYSKMGGDDVRKGMEWIQNQWSKHLGVRVTLGPREQGMYLQELRTKTPMIFRKGVGMDRPTCLAGLEVFAKGSPENFIKVNRKDYEAVVEKMKLPLTKNESKKLCTQGIKILLDNYLLIPLGEMHFTMVHDQKFKDWSVNEMNQLDLTDLKRR